MERGSAGNSEKSCPRGVERRIARTGLLGRRATDARPSKPQNPCPRASGSGASTGRSNKRFKIVPFLIMTICVEMANSLDTRDGSRGLPSHPDNWHLPADIAQKRIVALIDKECTSIDYELEASCEDLHEIGSNKRCLELPYAEQPRLQDRKHAMQRTMYMAIFRRIAQALQNFGFKFSAVSLDDYLGDDEAMQSTDVVILADYTLEEVALMKKLSHVRFIVVQTADSATLPRLACSYDDPRFLAYFQHTSLYPLGENNGPLISDERLYAWLDPMNTTIHMREPALTSAELNKVRTVIPYVFRYKHPLDCGGRKWFLQMQDAFEKAREEWLLPLEERKLDVVVVAPPNPSYPQAINEHRLMALEMVEYLEQRHMIKVKTYVRQPTTREFHEAVRNAKILVSTFGLGEGVGKDYETILSGAVLVKPYSVRLRSSPDIYTEGYSVSCRADFSDLEQVIMTILGHLRRAQALVDTAYAKLVKDSNEEGITHTIAYALKAALESPAAREELVGSTCKSAWLDTPTNENPLRL